MKLARVLLNLTGSAARVPLLAIIIVIAGAVIACGPRQTSIQDEAQQIVDERQHVSSVETMTSLLQEKQAAEARGTEVAVGGQNTDTASAVSAAVRTTEVALEGQRTATTEAVHVAVQATQQPIIAKATIAAAADAANVRATAVVEEAHQQQVLAAQATATAQVLATNGTETAQMDTAQAQANAAKAQAEYQAWMARHDAAAKYVAYCTEANTVASETTSLPDAIATARAMDTGYHISGSCDGTPQPAHSP